MGTQPIEAHSAQQRCIQNDDFRRFFSENPFNPSNHPRMTDPFQRFEL
jgi:hypothetical protein